MCLRSQTYKRIYLVIWSHRHTVYMHRHTLTHWWWSFSLLNLRFYFYFFFFIFSFISFVSFVFFSSILAYFLCFFSDISYRYGVPGDMKNIYTSTPHVYNIIYIRIKYIYMYICINVCVCINIPFAHRIKQKIRENEKK